MIQINWLNRAVCAAIVCVWLASAAEGATDRNWIGPPSGDWYTTTNWSPNGDPDPADRLFVVHGSPNTLLGVTVDGDMATENPTISLSAASTATFGDAMHIGFDDYGSLDLTGASTVNCTSSMLAYNTDSAGNASITASTWDNSGNLHVGYNGAGTLAVSSGGVVTSVEGYLGRYEDSTGNAVTVDGAGSTWDMIAGFFVGCFGSGALTISGGGLVDNNIGYIGVYHSSTGNAVTVDGTGSRWHNFSDLTVGHNGGGTLDVTGGGLVENDVGYIGYGSGSTGNAVTVDGPGSRWYNNSDLSVGHNGGGTLEITNGGEVRNNTVGYIGYESTSTGNTVTVDGNGSEWRNGGSLYVGNLGSAALAITNGGLVTSDCGYLGNGGGSTVTVDGAHSTWLNNSNFFVGYGSNSTLTITDGGVVNNFNGHIGYQSSSTDSTVTVDGAGSTWGNSGYLYVGSQGSGKLDITGGGRVENEVGYIGRYGTSTGNAVTVDGAGSTWDNSGDLYVGHTGSGTVTMTGGGLVTSNDGYIGLMITSTGNAVTVDGAGSTWDNSGDLYVGGQGGGTLDITDGGLVESDSSYIGYANGSTGNSVTVDGSDSTWRNDGSLLVGYSGSGLLDITGGGRVECTNATIGDGSGSTGNTVLVDGAGSTWDNSGQLYIGDEGSGALTITGGGCVETNGTVRIGYAASSTGNTVTVDGTGSTWHNDGLLHIGISGKGTLIITGGGRVENANGTIGMNSSSTGNIVTVDGAGSTWDNSGWLSVGGSGSGTLTIQGGGEVRVGDNLSIATGSAVNVAGGTIRFARPDPMAVGSEDMNFLFGTLAFDCSVTVTGAGLVGDVFGGSPTISAANCLEISGNATLATPVTLDGGTLSAGSLINAPLLTFNSGVLNLTADDLTIGAGGLFGSVVQLDFGQTINVTNTVTVAGSGKLLLGGSLSGGNIVNNGLIDLDGAASDLGGGTLTNNGIVSGHGYVSAKLANAAGGQVRSEGGDYVRFTGTGNTNAGMIEAIGGQIEFTGDLTNAASTGLIAGENAAFRFNGLSNEGSLALSFGTSRLYGDVDNSGQVIVSGNSEATFYDDVSNAGVIQVSGGSTVVFFGALTGNGCSGTGTVFLEGDTRPGFSPGEMAFGGNVVFGPLATLDIELAGTAGSEYDQLEVVGDLTLGGTLQVVLIDEFAPEVGDTFDILDWDTLGGAEFDVVELPELAGRKAWDTSALYSEGEISVIGMLDGDTDVDWDVDSVDLGNLAAVFGGEGDLYTDFNEDGRVDLADFALMRANFGAGVGSGAPGDATAATPEPATLILLAGGLPVLLRRRRRQFATDERG